MSLDGLKVRELHHSFGAEISGVDFSEHVPDDVFEHIVSLSAKYGVLVFRRTHLDDIGHIELARRFGPLFKMSQVLADKESQFSFDELAYLSNVDPETGEPVAADAPNAHIAKLSSFFHADLGYNQQRASWSLLRAQDIPPPGHGGDTIFADTRAAFEDLDEVEPGLKERLLSKKYVGAHSWQQALKTSNPSMFQDIDPFAHPMAKHPVVELHQPSERVNLYIGLYLHHIEGPPEEADEMARLQQKLLQHATQSKYWLNVDWQNPSDLIIWDNR
ncbi:alpha-ketoglutarate-dependent -dichlorophenoxyacetate [Colletotrichum tofieldiae]|uniref:Alpha-ketoglutarate-dependent-dichlorophenoxyacetate n=1 Tax=Colletotrichum tofieldiae TaxID=708197 RepID=A0A166NF12_9PEZI|nr:alpha-ketoglutarate-dependent -dichlorophenoxyacetate [Colletotrichum tofieldiae]